jgi:glutamate 5-kinase
MGTKLNAAKLVTEVGIPMVIANGNTEGVLGRLISGEKIGTIFSARLENVKE